MGSAVYLSGRQVLEISAFMENRGLSVDVANALTMTFEGDVLGVASSVGTMPQGVPGRHRLRFHGTAGMLEYDMLAAEAWLFTEGGAAEWIRHDATLPAYPRFAPVDGFVSTILDGTPNRAPGDLAAAAVSAIDAAYEAARTGARVSVHQGTITTPEG
jgi:predicted dehydrogenase